MCTNKGFIENYLSSAQFCSDPEAPVKSKLKKTKKQKTNKQKPDRHAYSKWRNPKPKILEISKGSVGVPHRGTWIRVKEDRHHARKTAGEIFSFERNQIQTIIIYPAKFFFTMKKK